MTQPHFDSLLRRVWETEDEELSCTKCFELVPQYVDLEIAGEVAEKQVPRLRQHLDQCAGCREAYEMLRDLVRLEADGRLPSSGELNTLP